MTQSDPLEYSEIPVRTIFIYALTMAMAWLVYGNLNHPEAAAIPGAIAGLTIALCFGREDWQQRWRDFMLFGAVGWGLGGMMPITHLMGFTNTGAQYWINMMYGTAGLSLVGFIWAGLGGFFTALPAVLKQKDLRSCRLVLFVLIYCWLIHKVMWYCNIPSQEMLNQWVYYYFYEANQAHIFSLSSYPAWFHFHGIPYLTAFLMFVFITLYMQIQKLYPIGIDIALQSIIGWFFGILILVWLCGWRLAPPQSDVWAGLLGMGYSLIMLMTRRSRYNFRPEFRALVFITFIAAFWGAIALPLANTLRLYAYSQNALNPSLQIMYLSQGVTFGIGLCLALSYSASYLTPKHIDPPETQWKAHGLFFTGLLILTGATMYYSVLTPWTNAGLISLFPADTHIAVWISLALFSWLILFNLISGFNQGGMKAFLPVEDSACARWLFIIMIWLMTLFYAGQNAVNIQPAWINILVWIAACLITLRVMILPKTVSAPIPESPWTIDITRRTVQHVLSWLIITSIFITGLTLFHTRLIVYPTKGHYFRFGPNAWHPGIESFLYPDEKDFKGK